MHKENSMKKLIIFILVVLFSFFLFLYIYNRKQNYYIEYQINGYKVYEEYSIEKNHYYLKILKNDNVYEVNLNRNYSPKRKIITSVTDFEEKNMKCIRLNDNILDYPICKQNNDYVSYFLFQEINPNVIENYNNIDIYDLMEKTYLVWNYRGFYFLSKDKITSIELLEKDVYTPYLIKIINDKLFIINYDQEYEFDSYYLINSKKGTSKKYEIDTKVSLDSYILGTNKNSVYIIDKKNKQEYEINATKGKIYKTGGKLMINNKWEKQDIEKLIKNEYKFTNDEKFYFYLENKTLYFNNDSIITKITNINVDSIISYNDSEVYFIANGMVYYFNNSKGLKLIMKYSEWNFNYINSVFVFE